MRDRVRPVAERIPEGHWLSYGDIAAHCVSPTAERTPGDAGVRKRSTNPWTLS